MSYTNRITDPRRRTTAIASVIAIHAAVGYVLVNGLSYVGIETIPSFHPIIEFKSDPPPPPPPVDQPPAAAEAPLVAPKPPMELPSNTRVEVEVFDPLEVARPTVVPVPGPVPSPLIQPRPQPSFAPAAARPRNDPGRWVLTEDYPASSLRNEEEGTTGFAVIVGSDGRVDACEITKSSGSARLDEATCRYVERRARFDAATDGTGAKVVGRYTSIVRWQIPR
ncbi:energy transducer TonB [Tsuneonella sp. HG222]